MTMNSLVLDFYFKLTAKRTKTADGSTLTLSITNLSDRKESLKILALRLEKEDGTKEFTPFVYNGADHETRRLTLEGQEGRGHILSLPEGTKSVSVVYEEVLASPTGRSCVEEKPIWTRGGSCTPRVRVQPKRPMFIPTEPANRNHPSFYVSKK